MLSKFFDFLGRVECYDGSDDDDHGRHLGILERLGGTVGESGDSCVTCVHDVAPFCRVFSVFSHPPMAQRGSRQLRTRNRRLGQRLYDGLQWMNRLGRRRDNCFTNSTGIGTTVAAAAVAVAESGSMMDGTDFGRSLVFLFHMGIGRVAGGRNWSSGVALGMVNPWLGRQGAPLARSQGRMECARRIAVMIVKNAWYCSVVTATACSRTTQGQRRSRCGRATKHEVHSHLGGGNIGMISRSRLRSRVAIFEGKKGRRL